MRRFYDLMDIPSLLVAIVTLILFIFALYTKQFWHDLLLEAAIFLISLKLIISSYRQRVVTKRLEELLQHIIDHLEQKR